MSRRYSPEEKQQILDRVIANQGDITRTARELGIPERTLWRWRTEIPPLPLPPLPPQTDSIGTGLALSADSQGGNTLPPDDLQALRDLKTRMLELANYIMADERIKQAIDAAPLKERIAAATQLIDRMIKLAAELPAAEEEVEIEEVIEIYEGENFHEESSHRETFAGETTLESENDFG